eukprot:CAMPEP_0118674814 /NCGR_PEP_ID=MMETSP0800-20121206/1095_1 /TAXON_ID=210618 ORGANISM="Striatella unipunctata, Strain CCMP2910" /NCGR_SAMPLE_ID=MMETSP0800 /ASSEMBLY_ACC=CAM_ASM_000638 /LENGTH=205 /DNA_ID=CAMNT_0006570047 /DNA_START=510 /DNA_END=1127 /DNA_ORIENTATION=+
MVSVECEQHHLQSSAPRNVHTSHELESSNLIDREDFDNLLMHSTKQTSSPSSGLVEKSRPTLSAMKSCKNSLFQSTRKLEIEVEQGRKSFLPQKSKLDGNSNEYPLWSGPTIEMEPGIFLPLRGSDETLCGLLCGQMQSATCWGCSLHLSCLIDANYVLCPQCRIVSPLVADGRRVIGGVGLGVEANMLKYRASEKNTAKAPRAA